MQLKDAIEGRTSVRRFHHKKPDWRKIVRAIDAARFAPTAGGKFVLRFVLVSNEKKIAEIAAATQQDFVGTAQYIVVAVTDDSALVQSYGEKGERYATQQAGAAIENFLLALTDLKLVTSWVGHFYEGQVRRTLDIPEGLHIEAVFPIGLNTKVNAKRGVSKKMKLEQVLYFDKWEEKKMVPFVKLSREAI